MAGSVDRTNTCTAPLPAYLLCADWMALRLPAACLSPDWLAFWQAFAVVSALTTTTRLQRCTVHHYAPAFSPTFVSQPRGTRHYLARLHAPHTLSRRGCYNGFTTVVFFPCPSRFHHWLPTLPRSPAACYRRFRTWTLIHHHHALRTVMGNLRSVPTTRTDGRRTSPDLGFLIPLPQAGPGLPYRLDWTVVLAFGP